MDSRTALVAAAVGAGVVALFGAWNAFHSSHPRLEPVVAPPPPVKVAADPPVAPAPREEPAKAKKKKANRRKHRKRGKAEASESGSAERTPQNAHTKEEKATLAAGRTLFVAGIQEDMPGGGRKLKKSIAAAFAAFRPRTVKVCVSHEGRTRGWAHVSFTSTADAEAALAAIGPTMLLDGRALRVAMATDKRDVLFPSLTEDQRRQLKLDSVALFSVADEHSSNRMATLLVSMATATIPSSSAAGALSSSFLVVSSDRARESSDDAEDVLTLSVPPVRPELVVTDATACVGGMTFPLARAFTRVIAIESDPTRYNYLMHNSEVCGLSNIEFLCGDFNQLHACLVQDVVVLDPPWGGPQYTAAPLADLFLGETSLTELALMLRHECDMLAVRLPHNYDADELVQRLLAANLPFSTVASPPAAEAVSPALGATMTTTQLSEDWVRLTPSRRPGPAGSSEGGSDAGSSVGGGGGGGSGSGAWEHPFIYRIEFDVTRLLVVCHPPRARSRVRFSIGNLDSVIAAINHWNSAHGKQHHPAFFDWDKMQWVPLSRWRGVRPTHPAPAAAAAGAAASTSISTIAESSTSSSSSVGVGGEVAGSPAGQVLSPALLSSSLTSTPSPPAAASNTV